MASSRSLLPRIPPSSLPTPARSHHARQAQGAVQGAAPPRPLPRLPTTAPCPPLPMAKVSACPPHRASRELAAHPAVRSRSPPAPRSPPALAQFVCPQCHSLASFYYSDFSPTWTCGRCHFHTDSLGALVQRRRRRPQRFLGLRLPSWTYKSSKPLCSIMDRQ